MGSRRKLGVALVVAALALTLQVPRVTPPALAADGETAAGYDVVGGTDARQACRR